MAGKGSPIFDQLLDQVYELLTLQLAYGHIEEVSGRQKRLWS